MNKEDHKEIRRTVVIVAAVVLLIIYSKGIISYIGGIMGVFTPFIAGIAIAFVLNIPMSLIERKLMKSWNGKFSSKIKRPVSLIASVLIIIVILTFVFFSIIPQMADTFSDIGKRMPEFAQSIKNSAEKLQDDYPVVNDLLKEIGLDDSKSVDNTPDWSGIMDGVQKFFQSGFVGNILSSTYSVASSIAGFIFKSLIAICFAIYILASKEKLLGNVRLVFETYMPEKKFKYLHHCIMILSDNFKKFIAGQCLEAVILGIIFAVVMAILRLPYVLLISVLIAFTALIPVVGAFIGCIVGAFLILIVSPVKMIEFVIVFQLIQQFENKLIYPRVVGSSVGLPSIWVFFAVTVGGSLCGVLGMLVFIPLTSTSYMLLKEDVIKKNNKKLSNKPRKNRNKSEKQAMKKQTQNKN